MIAMYSRVRASGFGYGCPYQPSTTCGPDATAIRVIGPALAPGAEQQFTVPITTDGAKGGDKFVNRAQARARAREQFDRPLIANQDVAFRLARLKIHHDAVWALIADQSARHDDGDRDAALAAGALAEAGTLAVTTTREAVQLHGAYGMTAESPVGRYYLAAPVAVAADAPAAVLYAEAAGP